MMLLFMVILACSQPELDSPALSLPLDKEQMVSAETIQGPVTATVEVWPKESKLGDAITLSLTVTAEPDVDVQLPPFGEALGQFRVSSFTPKERVDSEGRQIASQQYDLQAPASGSLNLPSLRMTFVDRRDGQDPIEKELLTDELPITVMGLLESDAPLEFEGMKPVLSAYKDPSMWWREHLLAALALLPLVYLGWRMTRNRAKTKAQKNAFDLAISDLAILEAEGLANLDDRFYAALSMIVRRYIEQRYGLSAPEQTTEEFLSSSLKKGGFSANHQRFLEQLLQRCDQVKFAGAEANTAEAGDLLTETRRFLTETRLVVEAA